MNPQSKRDIFTSELFWRIQSGNLNSHKANGELDHVDAWEVLHLAAQARHYFQLPSDTYDPPTPEGMDTVRHLLQTSGVSSWWDGPLDRADQQAVEFLDNFPVPFVVESPTPALERWVADVESGAASGEWWSPPHDSSILVTSRSLPFASAVHLVGAEDELGRHRALIRRGSPIADSARVFEITSGEAWRKLVDVAPIDVASSRRNTWGIFSPRSRWFLPNWARVAADYDAVHLTVNAYLDLSGVPLSYESGLTMIAGWGPDETVWLNSPPVTWGSPNMVYRHGEVVWGTTP